MLQKLNVTKKNPQINLQLFACKKTYQELKKLEFVDAKDILIENGDVDEQEDVDDGIGDVEH
jgi:hypothetical protein